MLTKQGHLSIQITYGFDLTHFEKITEEQIEKIEKMVNSQILANTKLDISVKSYDDAKNQGAEAFLGRSMEMRLGW